MYEWNEGEKKIDFSHNPFSMPQGGLEALETKDPLMIRASAADRLALAISSSLRPMSLCVMDSAGPSLQRRGPRDLWRSRCRVRDSTVVGNRTRPGILIFDLFGLWKSKVQALPDFLRTRIEEIKTAA